MKVDEKKDDDRNCRNENGDKNTEPIKRESVCSFYLRRKCKHGRNGEGCKCLHPKLCFSFMKKGHEGCNKNDCEYLHPKMCNKQQKCPRTDCKFLHPSIRYNERKY